MNTIITAVSEMERQEVWKRGQEAWACNLALPLANFVTWGHRGRGWEGGGLLSSYLVSPVF